MNEILQERRNQIYKLANKLLGVKYMTLYRDNVTKTYEEYNIYLYLKFIRYLVDYALRFVLSERAKNKHLEIADKTKAETYWEHLEAIEKREKAKYTIQYKGQKC